MINLSDVIVKDDECLFTSPAYPYFLNAMGDLMLAGHSLKVKHWDETESRILYATIDSVIIGHIAYRLNLDKGITFLILGSIIPEYRRCGVYSLLYSKLESISRLHGNEFIDSTVMLKNDLRLHIADSIGSKPISYFMVKVL